MNNMVTGNFKMRFIGKPNGVFMKNAPGNFIHGQVYSVPFGHSKFPYWEMLEEVPVLVAPEQSEGDDVFEDAVYVPDEEEPADEEELYSVTPIREITISAAPELIELTMSSNPSAQIDPHAPAIIEPYMMWNPETGATTAVEDYVAPEPVKELSRDEMKDILDAAGVPFKKQARTHTLKRLVDELASKE